VRFKRSIFGALAFAALLLPAVSGGPVSAAPRPAPRVKIVTQFGDIVVVLDEKRTPLTTANFLRYVDAKFYDGGTFFRVIPGFVIQGGNRPRENEAADPKIALEAPVKTGVKNTDGAISMARTNDPNSATSEFFICDGDQPRLDGSETNPGYAAFGHVVSGLNLVRKIARLPAQQQLLDAPVTILKIVRVR
jgi:cyclophilin family peptidyl-prolyl cis-trans isomerase